MLLKELIQNYIDPLCLLDIEFIEITIMVVLISRTFQKLRLLGRIRFIYLIFPLDEPWRPHKP